MLSAPIAAIRRARLRMWALMLRARLGRHGMRVDIELAPGVRFHTLPHLEIDPTVPPTRGGSLRLRVGRDVRLGRDLTIDVRPGVENVLSIGTATIVQSWCRLQLHGGSIEIGEHVHVRDNVQCKTKSAVRVGDRVILARDVILHATVGVTVGHDCGIGERTSLIDSDHGLDGSGGAYLRAPLRTEPIVLGNGVAVGANCVLLPGARMADGSALGAGSVLRRGEVPAGQLATGVPAQTVKDLRA